MVLNWLRPNPITAVVYLAFITDQDNREFASEFQQRLDRHFEKNIAILE